MASSHLPNYLRAFRKRLGLSQDEVAFLLGVKTGAKVCRHERFVREPSLEAILGYEAIFQKSVRELFRGQFQQIQKGVVERAKVLCKRQSANKGHALRTRRLQTLKEIVER
jgi:transcriptional regulator with XRE-family HTH domain